MWENIYYFSISKIIKQFLHIYKQLIPRNRQIDSGILIIQLILYGYH